MARPMSCLALSAAFALAPVSALAAPIPLTTLGAAYTQDFDTLASSGTSMSMPAGWSFSESGTNANTTYTAGTGSGNAGDTYSFGASGFADRALGGIQSGSLVPLFGASFTNLTGATITSLEIALVGEMWRLGVSDVSQADALRFQWSIDATDLSNGTWLVFAALDFASPVVNGTTGALNGNLSANRTPLSGTLTSLSIADGATFWLRWVDENRGSADDGLAIDDFSLIAQGSVDPGGGGGGGGGGGTVPLPGTLALLALGVVLAGSVRTATRRRISTPS